MKINKKQLEKFGNRIRTERKKQGLSQGDLARFIDRDATTISRWENGERNPTQGDLLNLSRHLPVSIQTLQSLAGYTPEFNWLASYSALPNKKGDILKNATESEKEQLRQYLHYIRFHDKVNETALR